MSDPYSSQTRTDNNGGGQAPKSTKPGDISEQARALGRDVKTKASSLADTAAETVKTKAGEMADSAKEFATEAGEKLRATVQDQKVAGADYVGNIANIIRRTANEFEGEIPQAALYIRKAASQIDGVSLALRNRDLSELMGGVQDFARRQPTAFFGAAVLVGFAAIRFLKSSTASAQPASPQPGSAQRWAPNGGAYRPSSSSVRGTTPRM